MTQVTLKTIEQNDNVGMFSICFDGNSESEFEKFLMEFKDNATYNKDFNAILLALSKGALERFFRIEGRMNDHVSALSIDSRKLRLYCLRISDQILILGNGGVKLSRTYQEDEKLSGYVMDLQTFDKVLLKAQKNGIITIEKNMINYSVIALLRYLPNKRQSLICLLVLPSALVRYLKPRDSPKRILPDCLTSEIQKSPNGLQADITSRLKPSLVSKRLWEVNSSA